jgi:antitoxin component YwqK of YwqJK toxin-antitoxin module
MQSAQTGNETILFITEIPYENGNIRFRYSRRMSVDGQKWVRHGLFLAYHENGSVASEGNYENDMEAGIWRDYHETGQLASEGTYVAGKEEGIWKYWGPDGNEEQTVTYKNGEEVSNQGDAPDQKAVR